MHQVETLADAEWNSLIASKPKEFNLNATQQFVAEASLLSRKWKDKLEQFQEVREKSLELVPELGPSFEGAKEEEIKTPEGQQVESKNTEEPKT
jgi:hypothetical protein